MDELTHMCWALLFLFFSHFFPFSSVKKDAHPNCEREIIKKEARKKREASRHYLVRATQQNATPTRADTA